MMSEARYDDAFYRRQADSSYRAAQIYAAHLARWHRPDSVVDLGCGRGGWLKAFGESGAARLVGYDGSWNAQDDMLDPSIEYHAADLNELVGAPADGIRFDLAISLEVAEHLQPDRSRAVVEKLCSWSDAVLFGAAFLHQPGRDHINLRRHSEWAAMFAAHGFQPYDLFRPAFWGHPDVPWWYQQNTFLYVREGSALAGTLASDGAGPVARTEWLDAVHPEIYAAFAEETLAAKVRKSIKRAIGR